MTTAPSEADLPEHLGNALVEALALPDDQQTAAIERLCQEYPQQADRIWSCVGEQRRLERQLTHAVVAAGELKSIGPYRIIRMIGEGAFGVVYLAERQEPMRMRVAVKVLKAFIDTETAMKRFEAERQALAVMQHDNIAKVLDAGVTTGGRPYFAMEYVPGPPITRYCDQNKLDLGQRLQLLRQVCAGVQHAHQKGVLHRDLKPSNILVTVQGSTPTVKIIDFGLARATDQGRGSTLLTEAGGLVGTPAYMSPEQATGPGSDLDTRTDVYSLGVLLYELLTGEVPFSAAKLRQAGIAEIQRILREVEPAKPSANVQARGSEATEAARGRCVEPVALARQLRGDLDWITMKALEKDRTRRYGTVEGLAEDIRRYLEDEAVEATPPTATYRIGKLVRRYRVQFVAAALVMVTSLAGAVVSAVFGVQAAERAEANRLLSEDYRRLRIGAEIEAVLVRERRAHPAEPEQAAELAWLVGEAERLTRELPYIERVLGELEAGHLLPVAAARSPDRGDHPEAADLAALLDLRGRIEDELRGLADAEREARERRLPFDAEKHAEIVRLAQQRRQQLEAPIAAVKERIDRSNRVAIPGAEDRFIHTRLDHERHRLVRLARDVLPDLRFRRDWAASLRQRSIADCAAQWSAATDRIRANELYGGSTIEPQAGLVPVGPDPTSGLEEFADLASGALPKRDANGRLELGAEHGVVLVLLPGGEVHYGRDNDVRGANRRRLKAMAIAPFFLAKHEISRRQWTRLGRDVPGLRLFEDTGLDCRNLSNAELDKPANFVSWYQCLRLLERHGFELPGEAEWEYACKAGKETRWYTGDEEEALGAAANVYDRRYASERGPHLGPPAAFDDGFGPLAPIHAPLLANGFGLLHMHGNVNEWCRDWQGIEGGHQKAIRGGSWCDSTRYARSTCHNHAVPGFANRGIGLRAARRIRGTPAK